MMKAEDDRKDDVSIEVTLQYEPSSRRLSVSAVPRPNKDKLTVMIVLIDGYAARRLDTAFYAGVSSGDPNDYESASAGADLAANQWQTLWEALTPRRKVELIVPEIGYAAVPTDGASQVGFRTVPETGGANRRALRDTAAESILSVFRR
jgi:hypothetical protein